MRTHGLLPPLLGLAAIVLLLAGLSAAAPLMAPLSFALFLIAAAQPLQARLERRLPRALALLVTLLGIVAVIGGFCLLAVWAVSRAGWWVTENGARILALYSTATALLDSQGLDMAAALAGQLDIALALRTARSLAGYLQGFVNFVVLMLILVLLGLPEARPMASRLAALGGAARRAALLRVGHAVARQFQRYLLVRTAMSLATGLAVYAIAWAFRLDLALEWGVLAFVLNYLPFIGPLVATVLPTLLAAVQFHSFAAAALVMLAMIAVQNLIGSYVEPRVAGSTLAISPFIVLLSVLLWTYLWGIPGAFLGVPISIALVEGCAADPRSRWFAAMLSPGVDEAADR